ncbi:anthranilate synthase component II [Volucribacter amazonae]|uniref:Anthranilate synthase component 2 n=1 Tax=Volucribacter amazonae TaxID=256731 RepID=A0A9X4PE16_9PAST|nr:anthranilate synthase component II [Volucribacter amazonae]MDG6895831.1 anthranilate synthase component 2 [Volucribacter amazonae]
MLLLIDNHDSFTYNLVDLLRPLGYPLMVVPVEQVNPQQLQQAEHILISPGPDIPQAYPQVFAMLRQYYQQKKILGVCLGHQILYEFFGGQLYNLGQVRHGQTGNLYCIQQSPLFNNIPSQFQVGLYHSWAADPATLPSELEIIAQDQQGIIMAIQHRDLPIYGVQFHPESFISQYGSQLIANWLAD